MHLTRRDASLSNSSTKRHGNTKSSMRVVLIKIEKLVLSWRRHYCYVKTIFSKNDVTFVMTSQAAQILCVGLFIESKVAQFKLVMLQKRLLTSELPSSL